MCIHVKRPVHNLFRDSAVADDRDITNGIAVSKSSGEFAASNIQHAVREARAVAVEAEHRKRAKYQALTHTHIFTPVSVETSGACGPEALSLFRDIAGRISYTTRPLHSLLSPPAGFCCHSEGQCSSSLGLPAPLVLVMVSF